VSFEVTDWPRADDIARYRRELVVPADAIVRDIARLITIAEMVHRGDLNDDWLLTGGMAMRLRGSPRFTMTDTDTARRLGELDRDRIAEALTVDQAELTVTPADATGWKPGKKLVTARPVNYEAFFAGIGGGAIEDQFTFTVSWRGVVEPAQHLALVHPYPELQMPQTIVPVMDLTEQLAEKIVGWCAHGLIKHYVDVAWAFHRLAGEIDTGKLRRLIESKLATGRELFPDAYAKLPDMHAVFAALHDPDRHVPPQGDPADDGAAQIRFAGAGLNKPQAIALIRRRALPAIFT
jgi:Nucleotidyl transferase AbiEii toxin, Type IV TA system